MPAGAGMVKCFGFRCLGTATQMAEAVFVGKGGFWFQSGQLTLKLSVGDAEQTDFATSIRSELADDSTFAGGLHFGPHSVLMLR
jgi:hypothetical protein